MDLGSYPEALVQQYEKVVLPLTRRQEVDSSDASRLVSTRGATLFPRAFSAEGALSGLLLKMGCWEASHRRSQEVTTPEGSYWHGIAHRMEPDAANARYCSGMSANILSCHLYEMVLPKCLGGFGPHGGEHQQSGITGYLSSGATKRGSRPGQQVRKRH